MFYHRHIPTMIKHLQSKSQHEEFIAAAISECVREKFSRQSQVSENNGAFDSSSQLGCENNGAFDSSSQLVIPTRKNKRKQLSQKILLVDLEFLPVYGMMANHHGCLKYIFKRFVLCIQVFASYQSTYRHQLVKLITLTLQLLFEEERVGGRTQLAGQLVVNKRQTENIHVFPICVECTKLKKHATYLFTNLNVV